MPIQAINPMNGKVLKTYKEESSRAISLKLNKAESAWQQWKQTTFSQRAKMIKKAAALLLQQKQDLAHLMALEMGKPLKEGLSEIEKCAWVCNFYAKNAAQFLKDEKVDTEAKNSFVSFQPLGVILAVMPWNFPFWQCFRFLAPALMAGNAAVLKHASNVPGCALAIEKILWDAGFEKGIFQTLLVESTLVSSIISHPTIKAVTLTGSTSAGKSVAKTAGENIKKTVLELGGSDPYIILGDADLEWAATVCAQSRLINNGQSCISAKRFIVEKKVEKHFIELLKIKMQAFVTGDPLQPETELGPLARADLRDELHQQVIKSIKMGAKCILGGAIPPFEGAHAFYTPTILTDVKKGMPAYSEELFGPVAAVISAQDESHAIAIANDSVYGLGAAIFTRNIKKGEKIARESLQAGACFVNSLVRSDPRLPFGGINQSGYGRELSAFGIREFVNIKAVWRQ